MGHYAKECPTVRRKKKLNFTTTLSDESENEEDEQVILFVSIEEESDTGEVMLIDEHFNVDEMLEDSLEEMLSSNIESSLANISSNTTYWYKMTLLDEMKA